MLRVSKSLYRKIPVIWALPALASFAAGLALAWHHPVWPVAALSFFYFSCIAAAWWPGIWLVAVPTMLPWLNFSPWTGWLIFDEFDLMLLAVFAGSYGRLAWTKVAGNTKRREPGISKITFPALVGVLGVLGAIGLARGFQDAGGFTFGWYQGYTDPLNSLRVFKSLLFGILTIPLLRGEMRVSSTRASHRLALGMVLGLASVSLAALWERAAYPGVFDFSTAYRITALFWEMHVGGGAIDAYLAMTMPFVVWALASAGSKVRWTLSALLSTLAAYACLTTFSRGVYLAVALSMLLIALMWRMQTQSLNGRARLSVLGERSRSLGRRGGAGWALGLVIAIFLGTTLGGGPFLIARLANADRDIDNRLAHWRDGIGLLRSPTAWMLGVGIGRLPANYARKNPDGAGEFPGRVEVRRNAPGLPSGERQYVTLFGPATNPDLGGLFALTQRVDIRAGGAYRISMDVRAPITTQVGVQLCERHLLYDWYCKEAIVRVEGLPGQLQSRTAQLLGGALGDGPWYAPRLGMLTVSVLNGAASVDFYNISLATADRKELLFNGGFSNGLARWFPAAQHYFLPWHSDSLYLEVLIERGIAGLLVLALLVLWSLVRLLSGSGRALLLAPYLAASLSGALAIGVVSSVMDVPRVAFLLFLLVFFALQLTNREEPS